MSLLPTVQAVPADARPTKTELFVTKWDDMWTDFVEGYSNVVVIVFLESLALFIVFKSIIWLDGYLNKMPKATPKQEPQSDARTSASLRPRDSPQRDLEANEEAVTTMEPKESHTLLWWNGTMACCVFFLGRSDQVATYLLFPLWLFSVSLNIEYFKQRLLPFSKSAGETFLHTVTLAAGTSGAFAYASAPLKGRCSDWLTYAAFVFLPTLAFYSGKWAATIRNSGQAKRIEEVYGVNDFPADEINKMAITLPAWEQASSDTATDVQSAYAELEGTGTRRNNRRRTKRRDYASAAKSPKKSRASQTSREHGPISQ